MHTITGSRAALAQQPRPVAGHGGLAGALAGADHRELGPGEVHARVARRRRAACPAPRRRARGGGRARPARSRSAGAAAPARRPGPPPRPRRGASRAQAARRGRVSHLLARSGSASGPRPQLLLAAAEHHAGQAPLALEAVERVADGGRMVLAVDERDHGVPGHPRILARTARSRGPGARAPGAAIEIELDARELAVPEAPQRRRRILDLHAVMARHRALARRGTRRRSSRSTMSSIWAVKLAYGCSQSRQAAEKPSAPR